MKNTETDYDAFIAQKVKKAKQHGFDAVEIKAPLFDWQKLVVRWALKQGRAALFEECGLDKPRISRKTFSRPRIPLRLQTSGLG